MATRPSLALVLVLGCVSTPSGDDELGGDTSESGFGDESSEADELADESDTGPSSDLPEQAPSDCDRLLALLAELAAEPDPAGQQALIDEFIATLSYGEHGFPIAEANKLAVVHRGSPGQALSLAGEFNDWLVGEHPLDEVVPGFHVAIVELASPASGLYKLVRGPDEFFADPLARRFGWDEFGEYSQIAAIPGRSHHERWPGFDQAIGELEPRTLTLYLPADAEQDVDLPVLYMHDGQNLFDPGALFGGWQVGPTLDLAIAEGSVAPLVVVGIANTSARFDEYTQVGDVIDGMAVGGRADEYADFVVEGVLPFVDQRYDFVDPSPEASAVLGSSLGGLVSLYIGLRHPDRFAQIGSMSGTIAWGTIGASNPTIVDAYLDAPPLGLRIYLDSGGDPGLGCPDDGSDNYCGNVELADALRGLGWVDELDLFYRWEPGASHDEAAWAGRLPAALHDWFPGP
ncbi:alpha/beta hydrolase [Nannocystaceae bacterium ST9]